MVNFLIFSVMFISGSGLINTPVNEVSLILLNTNEVEIQIETQSIMDLFAAAEYDSTTENLILETVENIHSLLIYDASGELEFMLPVMSKRVILGRNMFEKGHYQLGFNFEEKEELTYAQVKMK